jgi:hypothetical protein
MPRAIFHHLTEVATTPKQGELRNDLKIGDS